MTNSDKQSALKFPCEFPIKAMGLAEDGFSDLVFTIVKKHYKKAQKKSIQIQHSKKGNYISVTVTIQAESKEQLDAIYKDLTEEKKVLVAL